LSPIDLVDIPLVFLLDLNYPLPNLLPLALSHGTHQNAQSIPQPGRTAKPPGRATHRQRQVGPEASPSRDREKLRTRSRALEGVSYSIVSCRLDSVVLVMINSYLNLTPGASLGNLETPKAFIRMVSHVIDGRYGDPNACLRTVLQYWKNTIAGLDREGHGQRPRRQDCKSSA